MELVSAVTPLQRRRRRLLFLAATVVLFLAACGSEESAVDASGEPARALSPTTAHDPPSTHLPTPTTATTALEIEPFSPDASSMEEPAPPPAAPAQRVDDDACPPRSGDPAARYVVGFHEMPEPMSVGDEFACGVVMNVNESLRSIGVHVWDEGDFQARTARDDNVRYAERDSSGCAGIVPQPSGCE